MTLNDLVARLMSSPHWQTGAAKETTVTFMDSKNPHQPIEVQNVEFNADELGPLIVLTGEPGVYTTNN